MRIMQSPPAQHASAAVGNGEHDEQQPEQASSTRRVKQEAADGDRPRSASSVQSSSSVSDQKATSEQERTVLPSLSKGSDQLPPLASGTMQRLAQGNSAQPSPPPIAILQQQQSESSEDSPAQSPAPPQYHMHMHPVAYAHPPPPPPGHYPDQRHLYQYPPPQDYRAYGQQPPPMAMYPAPAHIVPSQLPPPHTLAHPHDVQYPYPGREAFTPIYTDDAATKLSDRVRRRCFNCCTTDTSTWRRSSLNPGKVLCNKCGLFERTHSRPRPEQFPHKRGPLAGSSLRARASQNGPSTPPAATPQQTSYSHAAAAHPYARPRAETMPQPAGPVQWSHETQSAPPPPPHTQSPGPIHASPHHSGAPSPARTPPASDPHRRLSAPGPQPAPLQTRSP
ncbi:unnamed protein product [Peniophora sp. CBMAI 1063]|nr:unnamed protein product [Peniophora sp. CBMAI 1063]